jgi:putative ABC transport system permease protein
MGFDLKSIIRNALNNKGTTVLNIFGLTIGLACSLFLISWVIHESSYDSFVKNKDKIYRVVMKVSRDDKPFMCASSVNGVGSESTKLFPEIDNYTRLHQPKPDFLIKTLDNKFFREVGYYADSTFFDILPYPVLEGDLSKALSIRNSIVIEKQLAIKCFGDKSAIGQQLIVNEHEFTVSAVIDNIPSNSHLQFRFLIPTLNLGQSWHRNQWGSDNSITYLKLNNSKGIELLNKKITDLVYKNQSIWKEIKAQVVLQNIKEIPFSTNFKWDDAKKSSKRNIYALSGIAFLIMLIACINFTNLFISSALKRNRATGIKLANGAHRSSIIGEYMVEVFLFVLVSFASAVIILLVLHPYLNHLSGSVIEINFLSLRFLAIAFPLLLTTALLAGFFPGTYLTRFKLVDILKNNTSSKGSKASVQNIMVTAQFVIATILVFAVLVIHKQVDFLQSKNLGFEKENVLYIPTVGKLKQEFHQKRLKNELLKNSNITAIAYRGGMPTIWNGGIQLSYNTDKNIVGSEEIHIGQGYFDLMNIDFIEGENVFHKDNGSINHCVINKMAAEKLNLEPPYINQVINIYGRNQSVVIKGVIENINTKSLAQQILPNIYFRFNDKMIGSYENGMLLFKIASNHSKAIADIQTYWEKEFPERPFEYSFLDQTYDKLYKSERKAREILSWFTLIALLLTSLGLLAMTYFITEQRTKEIGIRKVNGAKVSEILQMLNKDFIKWVAIAFVIAVPVAYFAMTKWLENFAYKTELSWWIFALAGVLALGIALLTVSWQSWKAATRNPVEALRYE